MLLLKPAKKLATHLQLYSDRPSGDRWTSAPRDTCRTTRYVVRAGKIPNPAFETYGQACPLLGDRGAIRNDRDWGALPTGG